jgi:hypothetical protein
VGEASRLDIFIFVALVSSIAAGKPLPQEKTKKAVGELSAAIPSCRFKSRLKPALQVS